MDFMSLNLKFNPARSFASVLVPGTLLDAKPTFQKFTPPMKTDANKPLLEIQKSTEAALINVASLMHENDVEGAFQAIRTELKAVGTNITLARKGLELPATTTVVEGKKETVTKTQVWFWFNEEGSKKMISFLGRVNPDLKMACSSDPNAGQLTEGGIKKTYDKNTIYFRNALESKLGANMSLIRKPVEVVDGKGNPIKIAGTNNEHETMDYFAVDVAGLINQMESSIAKVMAMMDEIKPEQTLMEIRSAKQQIEEKGKEIESLKAAGKESETGLALQEQAKAQKSLMVAESRLSKMVAPVCESLPLMYFYADLLASADFYKTTVVSWQETSSHEIFEEPKK